MTDVCNSFRLACINNMLHARTRIVTTKLSRCHRCHRHLTQNPMRVMFKYLERMFDIVWPPGNFQNVGSINIYRLARPLFPHNLRHWRKSMQNQKFCHFRHLTSNITFGVWKELPSLSSKIGTA